MNVQWYPGHMTKAKRMMQEDMKLIDLVIELVDARIPYSSRNPDIDSLAGNKSRVLLLNKADLADDKKNKLWAQYYREKGCFVLEINSKTRSGMKQLSLLVREACQEKIERDRRRGIKNRPIRAMVAGIPNVGKSTFINTFVGQSCTKTGNRPGVTKGKQWIRVNKELELLDTPGILWPKFEDPLVGQHLAFIGSINDEILQTEELALSLISLLQKIYPQALQDRYQLAGEQEAPVVLEELCKRRGCYKKGMEPDYYKAAGLLLDEFRNGQLGKMTLEIPMESF
ncbi:MAG: ribosome biogenesis GTPase YlqF [Lachnospiraceae bacterium]|nr:ribosome biogenesis GTPase YlqF [Lachnospiraceae bacterium]